MKRKVFLTAGLVFLFMSLTTFQTWAPPAPPAPNFTMYTFKPYGSFYDVKFSIYHIAHDGFAYYNEGPFYPDHSSTSSSNSQWYITYWPNVTYAEIWTIANSTSAWVSLGVVTMNQYNTTQAPGNLAQVFTVDMRYIENPED